MGTAHNPDGAGPVEAAARVAELEAQVAQLQEAVHAHADVDQAKGILCLAGRLTPDQAWEVLREVSQRTNIKLRQVAQELTAWARTGRLDGRLLQELQRQGLLPHAPPSPAAPSAIRQNGHERRASRRVPQEAGHRHSESRDG